MMTAGKLGPLVMRLERVVGAPQEFRARAKVAIADWLRPSAAERWSEWFVLVGVEYLVVGLEICELPLLVEQVHAASLQAMGMEPDPELPAFPGDRPEPYWASWHSFGDPPPLARTLVPARCSRQPIWEQSEYDVAAWEVIYQLLIRMSHAGDFDAMELFPLPAVDPVIVDEPRFGLEHRIVDDVRPPMGLAVALLLARQLAFEYASEHGRHDIAGWVFATLTGATPPDEAKPPVWVTPAMADGLAGWQPATMLRFCQRAGDELGGLSGRS